ncbi:MAG: serine hydrolase [Anaerolineaceae bacterium]|nr:serine hydrolase [Anaerolineaceae bacterium]
MNTFWKRFMVVCLVIGWVGITISQIPARAREPDYWPTDGWRTSTPEEQGMDSNELLGVLKYIERTGLNINSVTVVRHGYIVMDAYLHPFAPDKRHIIHSCTKSFTSALIGIAIKEGYLTGPDQLLSEIFPNRTMANLDANKEAITLSDLLTMVSGWECRDSYLYNWQGLRELRASDDWIQHVLDLPMSEAPGTRFEYCNEASFLLSAIITETTGLSAYDFAQEYLFGPLGFGEAVWPTNPDGINIGWGELRITPHDMAKFGYLYLHNGEWDGEQIIPASWVDASTQAQIHAGTLGENYGYQWWIESEQFYAAEGYAGQYIFVVPSLDMVVAFTSGLNGRYFEVPQDLLEDYIIPAAKADDALPPNPDALAELETLIHTFANPEPQPVSALPEIAQTVSGTTYTLEENDLGFETVTLTFEPGSAEARFDLGTSRGPMVAIAGLDGVFHIIQDADGEDMAAKGRWQGNRFVIDIKTMRHPWEDQYQFSFGDGTVTLSVRDNVYGATWRIQGEVQHNN